MHYCYNPRIKPIELTVLNKDLAHFNQLIKHENTKTNLLNNTFKKSSITGETFIPISSTRSYFIKSKKTTVKRISNLILVPNKKNKTNKTNKQIIHKE